MKKGNKTCLFANLCYLFGRFNKYLKYINKDNDGLFRLLYLY